VTRRPSRARPASGVRAIAWREFRNKLRTLWLVRYSAPPSAQTWRAAVDAVERRAPQTAVFALERLGRHLVEECWRDGRPPRGLFARAEAADLPASSLILLHAGMGLAFADRALAALERRAPGAALRDALHRFADLCRDNALEGYLAAAFEPLGVVVRLLHGRLFQAVEEQISAAEPEVASYYWHGVGRALYFIPPHLRPLRPTLEAAIGRCYAEPHARDSRLDALQGLFFAATMVNLQQPDVVAALLAQAEAAGEGARFSSGLVACLLARHDMTPRDPALPRLVEHLPPPESAAAALWQGRVAAPAREALRHFYPVLKEGRRLGLLAHRVSLPWVVERLEHGEAVPDV
jgi:hypothetical protein